MRDQLPLVCICIPTYNAAATIRETLESILAQTYQNLVVHVSDNASVDDTLKIVESIADARVYIHRQEKNIGAEGNFENCIRLGAGKYTAIFHADDIYEPDMVAKQVAFLEGSAEAGAVFTEASLIDETGSRIGEVRLPKDVTSQSGLYNFETMFRAVLRHRNFLICPSVMVRTEVYQNEIKCWRGDMFKSSADLDVWLRILQLHLVGYLPERLMRYRISRFQWSAKVRMTLEREDFFLVIDHYLEQEAVRVLLAPNDFRNYRWLERRDRVKRAVNLLLMDHPTQAKKLLNDIFSPDALLAAIKSKQGLVVLLYGVYVKLFTTLRLYRIGKTFLIYLKQVKSK